jgi:hypothetical protein
MEGSRMSPRGSLGFGSIANRSPLADQIVVMKGNAVRPKLSELGDC